MNNLAAGQIESGSRSFAPTLHGRSAPALARARLRSPVAAGASGPHPAPFTWGDWLHCVRVCVEIHLPSADMKKLNQITSRSVPGYVSVIGTATNTATVSLWGDNGQYAVTSRKGAYFRGELSVDNNAGPVWLTVTNLAVLQNGSNPDIITNTVGKLFVPKTPELFGYDLDGNLTNDGRWSYTWDAENRVTSFTRNASAPVGSRVKLDCEYDSKSRRTQKIVSTWNTSTLNYQPKSRS